jgi:hypothetical protein
MSSKRPITGRSLRLGSQTGRSWPHHYLRTPPANDWRTRQRSISNAVSRSRARPIPETWPELKDELEHRTARIETLAEYFDAVDHCACGAEIVEFDSLVESIQDHYKIDDEDASECADIVYAALNSAGMDDSEGTGLCNYCYHTLQKDD